MANLVEIEHRCERLETILRSPVVLAGVLLDLLREQVSTNPQLLHSRQLARLLLEMIQAAQTNPS